jgi:hypothetical protein
VTRTPAESKVRSRIRRCRAWLREPQLEKSVRWQVTKNLYYWYGFLDGMNGEKP